VRQRISLRWGRREKGRVGYGVNLEGLHCVELILPFDGRRFRRLPLTNCDLILMAWSTFTLECVGEGLDTNLFRCNSASLEA
jgi:hypothetical protein